METNLPTPTTARVKLLIYQRVYEIRKSGLRFINPWALDITFISSYTIRYHLLTVPHRSGWIQVDSPKKMLQKFGKLGRRWSLAPLRQKGDRSFSLQWTCKLFRSDLMVASRYLRSGRMEPFSCGVFKSHESRSTQTGKMMVSYGFNPSKKTGFLLQIVPPMLGITCTSADLGKRFTDCEG